MFETAALQRVARDVYTLIISVSSLALTRSSISPFTSIRGKEKHGFLMTATPVLQSTKTLPEQNPYTSLTHITGRNWEP
jgi:hypothetical protein